MEVFIVFMDTKTVLSKMVKAYTGHLYSHVSVSFNRELTEMYSFGRKDVENAFKGGFVKEDADKEFFQRADCAIYRCPVSAVQFFKMREYIRTMELKQDQLKYNLSGLFGIMLNAAAERKDAYFCSQFVGEVLTAGGIRIADKPSYLVMPEDIFKIPTLEYLYSGKMAGYPPIKKGYQTTECLLEVL